MLDAELKAIRKAGFDVLELTPYQFRVNHVIDLYPKRRKFHNIKSKQRGHYPIERKELLEFLNQQTVAESMAKETAKGNWYKPEQAPWWAKISK